MTLRPYRLTEEGLPNWVLTEIRIKEDEFVHLSSTFSLTTDDLAELRMHFSELASGRCGEFVLETTDGELRIEARLADTAGEVLISLWQGQPYSVSKGYRFLAKLEDLSQFVKDVEHDESVALPPARLP